MIEAGDICVAKLVDGRRHRVLVLSSTRTHDHLARALVAPGIPGLEPLDVEAPWRVAVGGEVFAVELIQSIPLDRILGSVSRAPAAVVVEARRAIAGLMT